MEEIIKVENLCFEYDPGLQTINNISFQIHKGEYVAILGHNGSGKSTIAKLLIGLLEKKSGEIYIDDYQLNLENLYKIREKVGIVFQNPDNQFIGATVRDDIAFGLENICVPREQMDELINRYSKVVRMENFWIMNQLNCPVVKNKELRLQEHWRTIQISCYAMKQPPHWILRIQKKSWNYYERSMKKHISRSYLSHMRWM